jgi:site-specific DNA recombinase
MAKKPPERPNAKRCAIYTRKSTSQGLEQEFNSLDAQRDACEAYAKAQGWSVIGEAYDDGGFTGANVDRPAFQRLLANVDAKKVDVIVVYKVDRLSRSLLDFAKVMDRLNQAGVAFVSITQNFSTADAMGRLTLNMLMSFAEFEREMIAERTRDKICAARRKGKWTGGAVPFGYEAVNGKLEVVEFEALVVREIFDLYLKHRSIVRILEELRRRGRTTKRHVSKTGSVRAAKAWTKDAVLRVLKNPLYTGRTVVGGEFFQAEHGAVIDRETFARVEAVLGDGTPRSVKTIQRGYLLRGLVRCAACGAGLTPASAFKGKREYRYYRCLTRDKQGTGACPCAPLPAKAVEDFVVAELRKLTVDRKLIARIAQGVSERSAGERATLAVELTALPAEIAKLSVEARKLVDAFASSSTAAQLLLQQRLDEVSAHLGDRKKRLDHVERRLAQIEVARIDVEWVEGVLRDFDPLWKRLNEENRARVIRALIEEVRVDENAGSLRIFFRSADTPARAA